MSIVWEKDGFLKIGMVLSLENVRIFIYNFRKFEMNLKINASRYAIFVHNLSNNTAVKSELDCIYQIIL